MVETIMPILAALVIVLLLLARWPDLGDRITQFLVRVLPPYRGRQ